MGFLSKLFGAAPAHPASTRRLPQVCLVDAAGLVESGARGKNGHGPVSPRDLFNTLRNLAEFASRESLTMTVFLTGRPLREAPDGGSFKGVKVHYAETGDAVAARILELVPTLAGRHEVVVVTANPALDKAALKAGASVMRAATLRKSREDKGDQRPDREGRPDREPRNGSQPNHPNQQQQQQRRRPNPNPPPGQGPGPDQPQPAQPDDDEPSEDDRDRQENADVRSLIDPL